MSSTPENPPPPPGPSLAQLCSEHLAHEEAQLDAASAALLGVPPEAVTLDLLADRLPEFAETRARIRQRADEVRRLNDSNATLLYYCLDFLQRFFERLTGRPHDGRYGPAGKRTAVPGGSLIDARG